MEKLKLWLALTGVVAVAVLAAGWFMLVAPRRASADSTQAQAGAQEQANATLTTQIAVLKAQVKGLPEQQAKLAEVSTKLPSDPETPALVRALTDAAAGAGVELVSITPGSMAPVASSSTSAATAVTSGTATTTTATTDTTATAGATATTGATARTGAQAGGVGTLLAIPLAINVAGGYYQLEQYLAALEGLPRALRVTGLTLVPGPDPLAMIAPPTTGGSSTTSAATPALTDGSHLLATITASVYVDSGAALTPAVPAAIPTTK